MEAAVCPSANDLFILAEKSCKLRAIYLWKAHGVNRAVRMVSNEVSPQNPIRQYYKKVLIFRGLQKELK